MEEEVQRLVAALEGAPVVLLAQRPDHPITVGVDHGTHAFIGKQLIHQHALPTAIQNVDARNAAMAGFGGGLQERSPCGIGSGRQGTGFGGANRMGRRAVDQNRLFEQGNDFRDADATGEIHHWNVEGAGGRGIHHGGLATSKDIEGFADGGVISDRPRNPRGHDFTLQSPVEQVLEVATQYAEHELHAEIFQNREVEQSLSHRRLRQQASLDQNKKHLPPELGNILENLPDIARLRHNAFLANQGVPARTGLGCSPTEKKRAENLILALSSFPPQRSAA